MFTQGLWQIIKALYEMYKQRQNKGETMKYLLILTMLTACGTEPQHGEKDETGEENAKKDDIEYQPSDNEKEVVVEYRKDGTSYSIAVNDTSELPECTRANSKQMAWIKKTEQFFSCEDESWVEVAVKGKDGVAGTKGEKGDKGEPGEPVTGNEWYDPITQKEWLFGAVSTTRLIAANACSNGYRLPTSAEAIAAVAHGLLVASSDLDGPANVWVSDPPEQPSPNDYSFYVDNAGIRQTATTPSHGIACLKE